MRHPHPQPLRSCGGTPISICVSCQKHCGNIATVRKNLLWTTINVVSWWPWDDDSLLHLQFSAMGLLRLTALCAHWVEQTGRPILRIIVDDLINVGDTSSVSQSDCHWLVKTWWKYPIREGTNYLNGTAVWVLNRYILPCCTFFVHCWFKLSKIWLSVD